MSGPRELVIIGGGEHARVVIEAARSRPDLWSVVGFVDPLPAETTTSRLGVPRLGDDEFGLALAQEGRVAFILGVGSVGVATHKRQAVVDRYSRLPVRWGCVVHAFAWVSPSAQLGQGVMISAGATVNSGARLGDHCVVNTGAVVEHDVTLGAFSQVAPAAAIGGGASIGEQCYLGLGCRVRDHVRIGQRVGVGMGAVVVASVPDDTTVIGVPARALKRSEP